MLATRLHSNKKRLLIFFSLAIVTFLILTFSTTLLKQKPPNICSGYEGQPSYLFYKNPKDFEKLATQCNQQIPELDISLKNKDFLTLMKSRMLALKSGYLLSEYLEEVPATIKFQGKHLKANIRLKGDEAEHLQTPTSWSLRIKLKKQQHVLSMNRFSLQKLAVRNNDIDPLYHSMMREQGIIAPRYQFVKVKVNGIDWGLMEMEDHFSREIQEANHHKESIIAKLDESETWKYVSIYEVWQLYNNPYVASLDFFAQKSIAKNDKLQQDAFYAKALMQAWQSQRLDANQIFDIETYKKFITTTELWGTWHPMAWNNLRFYYNPYIGKFEPVSFDNSYLSSELTKSLATGLPIFNEIIFDEKNNPVIKKYLASYLEKFSTGQQLSYLKSRQESLLGKLKAFNIEAKADMNIIKKNGDFIQNKGEQFITPVKRQWLEPKPTVYLDKTVLSLAKATAYNNDVIEITNKIPFPLTVKRITTIFMGIETNTYSPEQNTVSPSTIHGHAIPYIFKLDAGSPWNKIIIELESKTNRPYQKIIITEKLPWLDQKYFDEQANHHAKFIHSQPYIKQGDRGDYHIIKGDWLVTQPLVFPSNAKITIEAGCRLQFANNAYLKTQGPLYIQGTENNQVTLTSIDNNKTWKGIYVVRSDEKSTWHWANINNTEAHQAEHIELTGGISFYESDITMNNVIFNNTEAEDMLNIIHAQFSLSHVSFHNAASDAFDADFSKGILNNSSFENINGDGFDTSGSDTEIKHTTFKNIRDKAISIGETSKANIEQATISFAGTAVAVKDYSRVTIKDSTIEKSNFADMMSYNKKPAYGGALLIADNITIDGQPILIADLKSTLLFNQHRIPNTDINIKSLYKSGPMQK